MFDMAVMNENELFNRQTVKWSKSGATKGC